MNDFNFLYRRRYFFSNMPFNDIVFNKPYHVDGETVEKALRDLKHRNLGDRAVYSIDAP